MITTNKKILLIVDDIYSQGGTQSFALNLQNYLKDIFEEVNILSIKGISCAQKKTIGLNFKRNIEILFAKNHIKKYVADYDLIIVLSGQIFQYIFFFLDNNKTIYRESNTVFSRLSDQPMLKKYFQLFLYRLFLKIKPNLIAQNTEAYNQLNILKRNEDNLKLIPNPSFSNVKNDLKGIIDRKYDFAIASRATHSKGIDRINNFLKATNKEVLVIGEHKEKKYDFKENIKYVGRVNNVEDMLLDVKIVLLLSRYEGFPNVIHEGIQSGCIFIVSTELEWLVKDNYFSKEFVKVVNFNDKSDNIRQIENILTEHKMIPDESTRRDVYQKYSPNIYIDKILK